MKNWKKKKIEKKIMDYFRNWTAHYRGYTKWPPISEHFDDFCTKISHGWKIFSESGSVVHNYDFCLLFFYFEFENNTFLDKSRNVFAA